MSGTANYVTDYTGFNETNEAEQTGYYMPIMFTPSNEIKEAYMHVVGSKKKPVKMDAGNVVFLGKTEATARKKEIEITSGVNRFIIKTAGLRFKK